MKMLGFAAMSLATLLSYGIASAQDLVPPTPTAATFALRSGATLKSADGRRIGFIDRVMDGTDGQPAAAQVILDARIVSIPAATIKPIDRSHFMTSLSYKDVERL